jgi:glutamate synthase (NADPH/NADH) large chain
MTGGTAVILGPVGDNFGAGMSGGMAYVYDPAGQLHAKANMETLVIGRVEAAWWEEELLNLVREHAAQTGSLKATEILRHWDDELPRFWQVCPKEMISRLPRPLSDRVEEARA